MGATWSSGGNTTGRNHVKIQPKQNKPNITSEIKVRKRCHECFMPLSQCHKGYKYCMQKDKAPV